MVNISYSLNFIIIYIYFVIFCRTALPEQIHADTESSAKNHQPNTDSDWSRVSSANSLEWDNVPTSFQGSPPFSEVDTDTQLLLSEIERLTSQTLKETGKELFS